MSNSTKKRFGRKHWFLFEMPWHVDGLHTDDPPLQLIICQGPHERDSRKRSLLKLGMLAMEAGSWEARRYMQHALVVMAPMLASSISFKHLTMDELIDLYNHHCLGNVPLFE